MIGFITVREKTWITGSNSPITPNIGVPVKPTGWKAHRTFWEVLIEIPPSKARVG